MVIRAEEIGGDSSIDVVNPDADTSIAALSAWVASLERDADWTTFR